MYCTCACLISIVVVQSKSRSTLQSHGLQHAKIPCPSLSTWVCTNSCPSSQWCHPTISSSVIPFSYFPQSFSTSGSFPISTDNTSIINAQNSILTDSHFSGLITVVSRFEHAFACKMEKEMATCSGNLAWKISWTETPGGLQSIVHKQSDMTEQLTTISHAKVYSCPD